MALARSLAGCQRRPVLLDRHAGISESGMPGQHTAHNLETFWGAVGHQVCLPEGVAERGLDIERRRFQGCRQHLCDVVMVPISPVRSASSTA